MGELKSIVTAEDQDLIIPVKGQSEPHLIVLEKREPCSGGYSPSGD